ncbi:putative permease [Saprospira grandis DSM 2844]|uniref:Putative permease n=1 Tax=Saprospira grandis DSM 2844 TaxID=694433 RepID=J0P5F3_9BACT|nr:sodium-dependent bicarbonate transport family permease [Saprospira grandis]EJF52652.1 putative permease [Saprospira grandis DSM 2844]
MNFLFDMSMVTGNILSPPVLFFFLGLISVALKSDLEIPQPLPKLFSLYLLMDIGLHGGHELYHSGFSWELVTVLGACFLMASIIPIYSFFILRSRFGSADAAAIAATFGSISAVTFITGISFLEIQEVPYKGYMVAGMALMESPAIIIGVLLYNIYGKKEQKSKKKTNWGHILRDAFFNGSIMLLVGALLIGILSGDKGWHDFQPFDSIFKGMLCFYLLDNGIVAARRLKALRGNLGFLLSFSILMPLFNAALGIGIAYLIGLSKGNALLFCLLTASASYIAVPAAMRLAIPKSNPAFTVPVALGIVFPFNVIVGIPLYYYLIQQIL